MRDYCSRGTRTLPATFPWVVGLISGPCSHWKKPYWAEQRSRGTERTEKREQHHIIQRQPFQIGTMKSVENFVFCRKKNACKLQDCVIKNKGRKTEVGKKSFWEVWRGTGKGLHFKSLGLNWEPNYIWVWILLPKQRKKNRTKIIRKCITNLLEMSVYSSNQIRNNYVRTEPFSVIKN